jgi:obg-like ATPase 1
LIISTNHIEKGKAMSKKKVVEEPVALLGRVGTQLQVGIVGLPNVGKSTFFNVLTNSDVKAENFPFCTIKPSTSRCLVPDKRFDWLVEHWKPKNDQKAILYVTDIAGLVKGASQGEGLGNAFLSNIKAVDAIFHMIRIFEDEGKETKLLTLRHYSR